MFTGIGCFDRTFSLHVKPDSKPYQVFPRHIAYALQKPFKEELERPQQQDIITPLVVGEMVEWCNSLVLAQKPNGKVRLCLDPARLNQVLLRPVHRGPTLNDIFPKLNNVKYLLLTDVSSGHHNVKLDEGSSYLTTFLAGIDTKDCHLEQHPQVICFSTRLMTYSKLYLMYLAWWITY